MNFKASREAFGVSPRLPFAYPSPASKAPPVPHRDCTGIPPEALGSLPFIVCFIKMSVFDWKAARFAQEPLEWLPVPTGGALEGVWTDWTASQPQTLICMWQLNKDNDQ